MSGEHPVHVPGRSVRSLLQRRVTVVAATDGHQVLAASDLPRVVLARRGGRGDEGDEGGHGEGEAIHVLPPELGLGLQRSTTGAETCSVLSSVVIHARISSTASASIRWVPMGGI